ncbi:MAG: AAA family ATPase [Acidobacteriota bacterium]|nr:MAG: AAA family ATPase [Acidobacteriota bacterium]
MNHPTSNDSSKNDRNTSSTSFGSPFVPGIPLEYNQKIYGRDDAIRYIVDNLTRYKNINIVGKRRMGKSSLLNHLIGNHENHLLQPQSRQRLVMVRVDLQASITSEQQFYGKALRDLMLHLPSQNRSLRNSLVTMQNQLNLNQAATGVDFEKVLTEIKERSNSRLRPVLLVDEFEEVFNESRKAGFPFPEFYNSLRSQLTAQRLALVIFSRLELIEYFKQKNLTSDFPNYFLTFELKELTPTAADELLLQESDHQLDIHEAQQARQWAGLHPCALQCAGEALYQAKAGNFTIQQAKKQYRRYVKSVCYSDPSRMRILSRRGLWIIVKRSRIFVPMLLLTVTGSLVLLKKWEWLRWIYVELPSKINENLVPFSALAILLLLILGKISWKELLDKLAGFYKGKDKDQ